MRPFRNCGTCENNHRSLCPDWEKPERKPAPFCDCYKLRPKNKKIK